MLRRQILQICLKGIMVYLFKFLSVLLETLPKICPYNKRAGRLRIVTQLQSQRESQDYPQFADDLPTYNSGKLANQKDTHKSKLLTKKFPKSESLNLSKREFPYTIYHNINIYQYHLGCININIIISSQVYEYTCLIYLICSFMYS